MSTVAQTETRWAIGQHRDLWITAGLSILVALLFLASIAVGRVPLSLFGAARDLLADDPTAAALILGEIRLPRAILGVLVGACLGLAGAAMQALLRNPLAEPGILGVSASAALGAVIVLYSGLSATIWIALPIGGMAGAAAAVMLIYVLAGRETSVLTLILAGAAINALAGALTALALNLAPNPYAAIEVIFWLLGSLADRSFAHVGIVVAPMAVGVALLLSVGRGADALSLGEETAQSLGVNLLSVRLRVILGSALAVGAAVSVTGIIGFVGLVIPHLIRPLVGHQPSRLMIPSALGGATLVLAADIALRLDFLVDSLATGFEINIGVITAIVGAPFFFWLVLYTRRQMR